MQRVSHQNGSVVRKPRSLGPDLWVLRYMDADKVQKAEPLGTVDKLKTKAAARKQGDEFLAEIIAIAIEEVVPL
jgi:hypothetical protein